MAARWPGKREVHLMLHCEIISVPVRHAESEGTSGMAAATLSIASKNYGSWSLRGWLLCKMAALDFEEEHVASDDPSARAELLLLSPSFLVPCLTHDGIKVWDTL